MKALLEQQGLAVALEELPAATIVAYDNVIQKKSYSALILCLGDRVLREITKKTTTTGIWKKLETLYMTKSLANRLYLKKLYTFHMRPGKSPSEHIDEFHKLVGDLAAIDTAILDKDQALLLLTSLSLSYDNFMETLLYGRDTLKLEDVLATLNSRELQKMTEAKGDGGEGLYVKERCDLRDIEQGIVPVLLDWIMDSWGSYHITYMIDYLVDFEEYDDDNILLGDDRECRVRGTGKVQVQMRDESSFGLNKRQSGKIKVIKGSLVVLSGTRRANCRKQLGEYQAGWKIKTRNVLDFCNQRSTQQYTKSGIDKHLGVAVIQQQNGSPSSTIGFNTPIDMLEYFGWLASIKQGMLEPVKVKCIFLGYRKGIVGTSSVQVLQGVEFKVEPQEDHKFEVEPHGNVDHVAGSNTTHELFSYREDSNEAAFAVAEAEKIYAHESLTFNNTIACEAEIWATKDLLDKEKGNILGMKIVRDKSGNTLRVSQSRFYNRKLVQTLLEGHSILSLKGSLSGDCDVEKNDVGMLDKFDRGLQTDVQVFVDFDYIMGRSITVMGRSITSGVYDTYGGCKGGYLAKGTRNRVRIRAKDSSGYCYGCLVKGYPWSEVPA
ncbi:hypothetical protein Tco_0318144 [Tanacetum coccineum]